MDYLPDNITDCIFLAGIEIGKAQIFTDRLSQDYPFDGTPEAWELIYDYKRLAAFIDVTHGLIRYSNKLIEQAAKYNKGGAANE